MSTSRTISYAQLVAEADPNWQKDYLRPVAYRFSNGRVFYNKPNPYS